MATYIKAQREFAIPAYGLCGRKKFLTSDARREGLVPSGAGLIPRERW
jgi:hypothetical protein